MKPTGGLLESNLQMKSKKWLNLQMKIKKCLTKPALVYW